MRGAFLQQKHLFSTLITQDILARNGKNVEEEEKEKMREKEEDSLVFSLSPSW